MHIVIIMGPFLGFPPHPCGAVERIWDGLSQQFVQHGHQVTILLRREKDTPAVENRHGIRFIRSTAFRRTRSTVMTLLKDFCYSLMMAFRAPKGDILVTNSFFIPIVQRFLFWKKQRLYVSVARYPKKQMWLYHNAHRLAPVSTAVADAMISQSPSIRMITKVIPNPIDLTLLFPPHQPRPYPPKTITFTGRIHPEKGVHLLIKAFTVLSKDFPDIQLRIIGPWKQNQGGGDDIYFEQLKKLAGNHNITFVPPIFELSKLADELRATDIYVYPSIAAKGEAMPVAPMEAMATGALSIVSNLPMFMDYMKDNINGFVFDHESPKCVHNLIACIQKSLLLTKEQYLSMSQAAIATAQRYSYENIASLYISDFEQLIQN